MKEYKNKIRKFSKDILEDIITLRRLLHSYPELAFEEIKTGDIICAELDKAGITYQRGMAKTGIVAIINGKNPGKKTIGLRADMDALQISERTMTDYSSHHEGKMHACGHDVHMASLVGAAIILNKIKDQFEGSIKIIFQPSEEKYPGGAIQMIMEGVLENPKVSCMIGQHVHPGINAGKLGFKHGKSMASTDEVYINVIGKGGHAATPELLVDPVVVASHIIIGLQQLVSRMATPTIPTVLSFGRLSANGKTNVIPDEVFIEGTFRTVDENWRKSAHEKIVKLAKGIAESYGATCKIFIDKGYPFLFNDETLTHRLMRYAKDYLGEDNVEEIDLRMTAEDFAYFSHTLPSCFYRLGVKNPKNKEISNLHTSGFTVDESSLETGMGFMAWTAINELGNHQ
ncbi:MAG TPA: M20 family metallopeptidase [Bacteroidales bacterium]|nr:M20 family metallopeptidase [Bacteroidales bacterium]